MLLPVESSIRASFLRQIDSKLLVSDFGLHFFPFKSLDCALQGTNGKRPSNHRIPELMWTMVSALAQIREKGFFVAAGISATHRVNCSFDLSKVNGQLPRGSTLRKICNADSSCLRSFDIIRFKRI
jgi:hypothetical protein